MGRTRIWPNGLKALVWQWDGRDQGARVKFFWDYLMHGVLWGIWRERNLRVFEDKFRSSSEVIDSIVREVGDWVLVLDMFQGNPLSLLLFVIGLPLSRGLAQRGERSCRIGFPLLKVDPSLILMVPRKVTPDLQVLVVSLGTTQARLSVLLMARWESVTPFLPRLWVFSWGFMN